MGNLPVGPLALWVLSAGPFSLDRSQRNTSNDKHLFLKEKKDPRQEGLSPWDHYHYTGSIPKEEKQLNPKR